MGTAEAIAQAFRLFVLLVGFAISRTEEERKRLADWRQRQLDFEDMVNRAVSRIRIDAARENQQVQDVDDAVDRDRKQ